MYVTKPAQLKRSPIDGYTYAEAYVRGERIAVPLQGGALLGVLNEAILAFSTPHLTPGQSEMVRCLIKVRDDLTRQPA